MKYLESRIGLKKKLGLVALAGTMALPLLAVSPQAVEAAPRWGQHNRNRDRNTITITGRVVDSRNMKNTLRVRASRQVYTVPTGTAHRYRVGDRVTVTGRLSGNTILNARVSR